ncbi:MAG: ABC transporter ATP-binding protein [Acidimicrobiales bacterium]
MSAPVITVDGVSHRYGTTTALDIGHLVIGPGATAILGPNGSGKSPLLRLVATVATRQSGSVRVDGLDPDDPATRVALRRRLGYLGQDDGLPPRMRVGEFCEYVGALKEIRPQRLRRRWCHWALTTVGLDDVAGDRISTLSGGMRRRLALAQALLGDPDLLVLDEPLSSLDAHRRGDVVTLVADRAGAATLLIATHEADELATVCGNVVVMDRGRAIFTGTPQRLASTAAGLVWETDRPPPGIPTRAVAPGRFRCIGEPPRGAPAVTPSVADGYVATLGRAG